MNPPLEKASLSAPLPLNVASSEPELRIEESVKGTTPVFEWLLPWVVTAATVVAWELAVRISGTDIFPSPIATGLGLAELAKSGVLFKYTVASLARVTWGFTLATITAVPLGLTLGWYRTAHDAINPVLQMLRPISPIAWIPIAILWFGVSDASPVFLIFLASFFPILVSATAAAHGIEPVYLRAARNFGLRGFGLLRSVILPASLPQILTGMRIALGVAWMVVVAAEMIAVNSGLGYLIIDARNAGKRYDLVVAGMIAIGAIGFALERLLHKIERADELRWGYRDR